MIIDLQRRLAECGRIRIGQQVATGNGKTRPAKLDTFRLTSPDRQRIAAAAHLYGGTAAEWQAPAGGQWEVVTGSDALDVIVPPSDMAFSQHYELWSAGGCQRRCDGRTESISDGPCVCDPESRQCDIHTRLSVMLRDLPGLGVWRIDTQGYYAAVELQGAVEVVQMAAGRGQMLPARLRLEQRVIKRPGVGTRRFAVPVLDIEVAPGQLLGGARPMAALQTGEQRQITDGARQLEAPAPLTPVPETAPEAPARSVAEQATATKPKAKRKNAAQPVPATGLAPRTAAQAAEPPPEPPPDDEPPDDGITKPQLRKMAAAMREAAITDRETALAFVTKVIGREVTSRNELTKDEAGKVIDALEAPPDTEPAQEPGAITNTQLRTLGGVLRKAGLGEDAAARSRLLTHVAGRHVGAVKDLNDVEANHVIDQLQSVDGDDMGALLASLKQEADEQALMEQAEAELADAEGPQS